MVKIRQPTRKKGASKQDLVSLFVYGSLLEPQLRLSILGHQVRVRRARLSGYERRRGRYFYVVSSVGTETQGAILSGLSAADFARLDDYEDVPRLYSRVLVEVQPDRGEPVTCWCYLPTSKAMG